MTARSRDISSCPPACAHVSRRSLVFSGVTSLSPTLSPFSPTLLSSLGLHSSSLPIYVHSFGLGRLRSDVSARFAGPARPPRRQLALHRPQLVAWRYQLALRRGHLLFRAGIALHRHQLVDRLLSSLVPGVSSLDGGARSAPPRVSSLLTGSLVVRRRSPRRPPTSARRCLDLHRRQPLLTALRPLLHHPPASEPPTLQTHLQ